MLLVVGLRTSNIKRIEMSIPTGHPAFAEFIEYEYFHPTPTVASILLSGRIIHSHPVTPWTSFPGLEEGWTAAAL
jgi:hypothetical protein